MNAAVMMPFSSVPSPPKAGRAPGRRPPARHFKKDIITLQSLLLQYFQSEVLKKS
jgi:hypothetical protein